MVNPFCFRIVWDPIAINDMNQKKNRTDSLFVSDKCIPFSLCLEPYTHMSEDKEEEEEEALVQSFYMMMVSFFIY